MIALLLHFLLFWKSLLSAFNDQIFAPKIVKGIPQQQGSVPDSVDLGIGYLLEASFDKWTCGISNFSFDRKLVTLVLAHIQSNQPNWQAFNSMLCVSYNNIHRLLPKIPWYPLLRCSEELNFFCFDKLHSTSVNWILICSIKYNGMANTSLLSSLDG